MIIDKLTGELKTIRYSVIEVEINKKLEDKPAITPETNTKLTYDEKGLVIKEENVMCDIITFF